MEKHVIAETTGISYTLTGDYYLPNLALPNECDYSIGRFGRIHLRFIKEHRRVLYINLLTTGKLRHYLHDIDVQANERFSDLVAAYAKAEGTDESLKAREQMRWVGLMNNYRHCAEEVLLKELSGL